VKNSIFNIIGVQPDNTQHKEKFISAFGSFLAISLILIVSSRFLSLEGAAIVVASMGASAVLLFAVPHGPLSQIWPVAGGHFISAVIGVSCQILIDDMYLAAALAVSLSIFAMYYLRCIHPPGGATALSAVIGGTAISNLGYSYCFTPVLINVIIILTVAFIFNFPFAWRRYPAILIKTTETPVNKAPIGIIQRDDLQYALETINSFTDISEDELERIYQTANQRHLDKHLKPEQIKLGHYYLHAQDIDEQCLNTENENMGAIRRVIDDSNDEKNMLIYKIITGAEKKKTAVTSREEFAKWAKHEVIFKNNQWQIIT
jgi:CBS domain-containing membrane protein